MQLRGARSSLSLLTLSVAVSLGTAERATAQRKSEPVLRLNAAQLGPAPEYPDAPRSGGKHGMARPVIMLTGYWPPTNEMIRRFSTDKTKNPGGWIGSDWEKRGYDVHAFFPEYPSGSYPKGVGDFEVDYQDTTADWARITKAMKPRAIITFSRGGATKNWEIEMNARNHSRWVGDSLAPRYPNPSPPDSSIPANTYRRSTLPAREILAALSAAKTDVNGWACFRRTGGSYLSEFISYHGLWYKNTHSDRTQADWCAAAGHIHVGPHAVSTLEKAVFVTLRELIEHVDRVTTGREQQNYGYGQIGTAILSMGGQPFGTGRQDLNLTGVPANTPMALVLSNAAKVTTYNNLVHYVTNPLQVVWPATATAQGTFDLKGIASGGPGTLYGHFVYADSSLSGAGISNALEIQFK